VTAVGAIRPVFIGGCGRSGTTFLAALLGGHPQVIAPPEAQFVVRGLSAADRGPASEQAARFTQVLREDWRLRLWGLPDDRAFARAGSTPGEIMSGLAQTYAATHGKPLATVWVDHSPNNILYGKTLLEAFPESVMVHLVRDPRGVAASVLPLDWGPASPRDAARWWLSRIGPGLAAEAAIPDRVIRVHYEQLIANPDGELRRLCGAVGLEFDPTMIAGGGIRLPLYTRSQHELVGEAPDPRRIAAWRDSLGAGAVAIIEAELGDTLALLGYEPVTPQPAVSRPRGAREAAVSLLRTVGQRFRASRRRRKSLNEILHRGSAS
jgi:Sulfotransferase family